MWLFYSQGAGVAETEVAHGWPVIFFRWAHDRARVDIYVWHPSAFSKTTRRSHTMHACTAPNIPCATTRGVHSRSCCCHATLPSLSSGQQMKFDGVRECRNKSLRRRRVGSNALQKQISPELIPCGRVSNNGIAKNARIAISLHELSGTPAVADQILP